MKQCQSYCVVIQSSMDLIGFLVYPWLNFITIVLSVKLLNILTSAHALGVDRLTDLSSVQDVVRELLAFSKQWIAARSSRPAPCFLVGDFSSVPSKGLRIHSQKCKHLRDQRLGPFKVIEKVDLKSFKLKLHHGCILHLVFHSDLPSKASSSTPLRHQPYEIKSDHNEYAIDYVFDAKVDNRPNRHGSYLQFLTYFLLDVMSLRGFYLNKWMIVNNYPRSSYHMFGHNFLKHKLMFNFELGILLEMMTWTNKITDFSLKGGVSLRRGMSCHCYPLYSIKPYATFIRMEWKPTNLTMP